MNNTQKVFSSFNPLAPPISGIQVGVLRSAERISKNTGLTVDIVSGILNDPIHSDYISVIPRSGESVVYKLNYSKFLIANMLPFNLSLSGQN